MSKNNPENKHTSNPVLQYTSMLGTSVLAQPFITLASKLNAGKATYGLPYKQIFNDMMSSPLGCHAKDSLLILRRRAFSSLLPGTVTSYLGQNHHMTAAESVAINTTFETTIAAFLELGEKFNVTNGREFPIVNEKGMGLDLSKMDKETFNKYNTNPKLKFDTLLARQMSFKQNIIPIGILLSARNAVFSSAIFMASPLAKSFVRVHGDKFSDAISLENQEIISKNAFRFGFATATTPLDTALTRLCSGQFNAQQLAANIVKNPRLLFTGAVARGIQCYLTSSTVGYGIEIANNISRSWQEYSSRDQTLENSDFRREISLKQEEEEFMTIQKATNQETSQEESKELTKEPTKSPSTTDTKASKVAPKQESKDR